MNQRYWLLGGAALVALVAIVVVVALVGPDREAGARDYNLIGMLREMEQTNSATRAVNDRILDSLSSVESQAARVAAVDARLSALESGLVAQQRSLERLRAVTADEAYLSRKLQELSASAATGIGGMAETARAEAQDVAAMKRVTATLTGRLNEIGRINAGVADKLGVADGVAARILNDMP